MRAALALVAAAALAGHAAAQTTVSVALEAPWPSSRFAAFQEASEFLADEDGRSASSGSLFWGFVARVHQAAETDGVPASDAEAVQRAVHLAEPGLRPLTHRVLQVAVGSRAYSAAVESQRQLADAVRQHCPAERRGAAWGLLVHTGEGARTDTNGVVHGRSVVLCALADAVALLDDTSKAPAVVLEHFPHRVFASDHIFPVTAGLSAHPDTDLVVFGALGSREAAQWHAHAARWAEARRVRYLFRHAVVAASSPSSSEAGVAPSTHLAGFGVSLDIKNMEYKAIDDRSKETKHEADADSSSTSSSFASPSSSSESELLSSDAIYAALGSTSAPAWLRDRASFGTVLRDLDAYARKLPLFNASLTLRDVNATTAGLRFTSYLMRAVRGDGFPTAASSLDPTIAHQDPLLLLAHLTGNFPSVVTRIAAVPVGGDIQRELARNQRSVAPGRNAVLVNGQAVDVMSSSFNFFALLRTLQNEAATLAQFAALPLSADDRLQLRSLAGHLEAGADADASASASKSGAGKSESASASSSSSSSSTEDDASLESLSGPIRVDIRAGALGHIAWLNDIERDEAFARWPANLEMIHRHAWSFHQIRRNLYTSVVVMDAGTPAALRALLTLLQFMQYKIPLRIGLVLASNEEDLDLDDADGTFAPLPDDLLRRQRLGLRSGGGSPLRPLRVPKETTDARGAHIALLYHHIARHSPAAGRQFLTDLAIEWQRRLQEQAEALRMKQVQEGGAVSGAGQGEDLDLNVGVSVVRVRSAFVSAGKVFRPSAWKSTLQSEFQTVLRDESGVGRRTLARARAWLAQHGLPVPCFVMNGQVGLGLELQQTLTQMMQTDMGVLRSVLRSGALAHDDNVLDVLLRVSGAIPVYNPRILADKGSSAAMMGGGAAANVGPDKVVFLPLASSSAAGLVRGIRGVHAPGTSERAKAVTVALVDDFHSASGLRSAETALHSLQASPLGEEAGLGTAGIDPATLEDEDDEDEAERLDAAWREEDNGFGATSTRTDGGRQRGGAGYLARLQKLARLALIQHPSASSHQGLPLLVLLAQAVLDDQTSAPVRPDERLPLLAELVSSLRDESAKGVSPDAWVRTSLAPRARSLLRPRPAERLVRLALRHVESSAPETATLEALLTHAPALAEADVEAEYGRLVALATDTRDSTARLLQGAGLLRDAESSGATRFLLANGRAIALAASETLRPADFALLAEVEARHRGLRVLRLVRNAQLLYKPASSAEASDAEGAGTSGDDEAEASPLLVNSDDVTVDYVSSIVAASCAVVGDYALTGMRQNLPIEFLGGNYTSFVTLPRSGADSGVDVLAILDPLSDAAQRAAPLLLLLRDGLGARVRVFLNPRRDYESLPLQTFYRFVAPTLGLGSGEAASFGPLPTQHVLTMKVFPPEPWNVQASVAPVDTDNMVLAADANVKVVFSLRSLLVAGQCSDLTSGQPPNGLQLLLRNGPGFAASAAGVAATGSDTLVMQNLGYFQLKAQPGVHAILLAPGRASRLFDIIVSARSGPGGSGAAREGGGGLVWLQNSRRLAGDRADEEGERTSRYLEVEVRDFSGPVTQLRVRKKPGLEHEKLLATLGQGVDDLAWDGAAADGAVFGDRLWMSEDDSTPSSSSSTSSASAGAGSPGTEADSREADVATVEVPATPPSGGLWSQMTSFLGFGASSGSAGSAPASSSLSVSQEENTVHVFSLASGHLYERFMKIMMLSVVKRCSRPVKFWLVENFLSPGFKEAAPALAKAFGFEVAFVTYKWPNWLHAQTEKQRIIWGYKILFLDVLFPLGLKKVIYVDGDQVVRADLAELWDHDLEGAPYAYTPFCDSRKETLGFQFWRTGYWKDHLRGRPYHISALYVVDLVAFRRWAVGDTLRSVYDQLSRDPNSLANLDQDLPNYAQHMVPIHSLPQEWLWCESWCSDDSKPAAKTIDLCNNPLHKEPKLNMARRVIQGGLFRESWEELDREVEASETRPPA